LVDTYAKYITLFKILTESEFGQQIIKKKKKSRKPDKWVMDVTTLTVAFSKHAANWSKKKKDWVIFIPTVEASSDNKFIHKYFY